MSTSVATANVVLRVSHDEAQAIVEGLQMLLNCRRFSFKEPDEEVRQLHAELFATVERIAAEVASQSPASARGGRSASAD